MTKYEVTYFGINSDDPQFDGAYGYRVQSSAGVDDALAYANKTYPDAYVQKSDDAAEALYF